ncbi:MAG: ABC transporter ATP-binding protein [Candidatus Neomarinimicrobiota bacterium]
MLKVENLHKSYGKEKVLHGVNLHINSGEIVTIVGSSGSGKTTLLRLISGLEIPDSGKIVIKENEVNSSSTFSSPEKRNCSLVFQDYALFPNMSMFDNIYFGRGSKENKEKVEDLINITNIENILDKFPHECSGGEQQRVALVRSMAIQPELILMDEPLSNLDYHLKSKISTLICEIIKKFKTTAVIVTHDIMDAMKISDRIIVFGSGNIIQDGTPNEIYDRPNSKEVALLFGQTNFIPLELFPESKYYFMDITTEKSFIPIRPEQFVIYDENFATNRMVFSGKINSIKKIGSNYNIELITKDLSLLIQLTGLVNLKTGQEIKVMS